MLWLGVVYTLMLSRYQIDINTYDFFQIFQCGLVQEIQLKIILMRSIEMSPRTLVADRTASAISFLLSLLKSSQLFAPCS